MSDVVVLLVVFCFLWVFCFIPKKISFRLQLSPRSDRFLEIQNQHIDIETEQVPHAVLMWYTPFWFGDWTHIYFFSYTCSRVFLEERINKKTPSLEKLRHGYLSEISLQYSHIECTKKLCFCHEGVLTWFEQSWQVNSKVEQWAMWWSEPLTRNYSKNTDLNWVV